MERKPGRRGNPGTPDWVKQTTLSLPVAAPRPQGHALGLEDLPHTLGCDRVSLGQGVDGVAPVVEDGQGLVPGVLPLAHPPHGSTDGPPCQ